MVFCMFFFVQGLNLSVFPWACQVYRRNDEGQ
jgi:hypothetical protein